MLTLIRSWLNTPGRPYYQGIVLLSQFFKNKELLAVMKIESVRNKARLESLMWAEFERLKATEGHKDDVNKIADNVAENAKKLALNAKKLALNANDHNPEFEAAKNKADKAYRVVMAKRAVLFDKCGTFESDDVNSAKAIEERGKLALEVVQGYKAATLLYLEADDIKVNGTPEENVEESYAALPDRLIPGTILNIRKNLSKLRKKEPTELRLKLISQHEANLSKLIARWDTLQ